MTASTVAARDLNINQIVTMAHRKATLISTYQNCNESQRLAAIDTLETICNGTATKGRFARVVDFRLVTLVQGQWQYPMPTDVIDVVNMAMYIDPSQSPTLATTEIPVSPMSREQWEMLQPKSQAGYPLRYYPHRETDPVEVRIWPVPDAAANGGVIRFECHRLRATMADGAKTPDFERYWQQFFIYELGYQLAEDAGILDVAERLRGIAKEKLQDCRGTSNQQGAQYLRFGHRSGQQGRR